jgi:hypothetical protein
LAAEDAVFIAGFQLTEYAMDDIKFVAISEKAGLISYIITEKAFRTDTSLRLAPTFRPCGLSAAASGSVCSARRLRRGLHDLGIETCGDPSASVWELVAELCSVPTKEFPTW